MTDFGFRISDFGLLGRAVVASLILCAVLAGCAPETIGLLNQAAPGGEAPQVFDDRDWATVLRENVKDRLVDYDHLLAHSESLDGFLRLVASVGPSSTPSLFPSPQSKLAYYVNAYNAGVLKAVVLENAPASMYLPGQPALDHRYHYVVDCKQVILADVRAAARAVAEGDPRVEFALSAAALGSPAPADQPWRADTLTRQLEDGARMAMDDRRMVTIDHATQHVLVGLPISERRDAFLAHYTKLTGVPAPTMLNVLLMMAGSVRREWLNTAVGYAEGVIPFDRALNRWGGPRL